MPVTRNLAEAIRRKLASDNDLATAVDAERFNLNVGSVIYEARNNAGLTQQQLADRVGMHQSAIARLEDADYYGHSLKTLERIAAALGKRLRPLEVDFNSDPAVPAAGRGTRSLNSGRENTVCGAGQLVNP